VRKSALERHLTSSLYRTRKPTYKGTIKPKDFTIINTDTQAQVAKQNLHKVAANKQLITTGSRQKNRDVASGYAEESVIESDSKVQCV